MTTTTFHSLDRRRFPTPCQQQYRAQGEKAEIRYHGMFAREGGGSNRSPAVFFYFFFPSLDSPDCFLASLSFLLLLLFDTPGELHGLTILGAALYHHVCGALRHLIFSREISFLSTRTGCCNQCHPTIPTFTITTTTTTTTNDVARNLTIIPGAGLGVRFLLLLEDYSDPDRSNAWAGKSERAKCGWRGKDGKESARAEESEEGGERESTGKGCVRVRCAREGETRERERERDLWMEYAREERREECAACCLLISERRAGRRASERAQGVVHNVCLSVCVSVLCDWRANRMKNGDNSYSMGTVLLFSHPFPCFSLSLALSLEWEGVSPEMPEMMFGEMFPHDISQSNIL